ncbi:MAG: pyruvate, phosphate dikinase [Thermoleophilia bacterium]|nr:pyruvate, phosphate dikinase [Thermoleophilia bacterium]MDH4340810.1 pyruvate, phosphate dikinase [Thermoleophilia bacterium]MDH5280878.1 pyruvate, phosphate dikinase [Thermoleophilia bacterium]
MRYVFDFEEDSGGGRELLGGKGIGLAEMTQLGIPVPAGFTITTDACRAYMATSGVVPEGLDEEVARHIAALEGRTGKRFGDENDPLLVSVRSGAAISMPGMMDTILNLGLNDVAAAGLGASTRNSRFAFDSYRRLIQMYGEVVDGVDGHRFEQALSDLKSARGVSQDVDLTADDLGELVDTFNAIYEEETGERFPQDAREQLRRAYRAVFDSWNAPRAQVYRRTYDIPDDLGTAVNVVQMVFGNRGETSGTGVCFTRDPATGERRLFGEFLSNAQGEDVVAGIRTPEPIERMRERMPESFDRLVDTLDRLEAHYRDLQDIEFTVEEGTLYLLQTRTGKRTAAAALRAAVEMVDEGLISREEAVARIDPGQLDQLLHPMIDPDAKVDVAARGLSASPGAASGAIVLDADTAEERGRAGDDVILVSWETTPDDIHGLIQARGVLTAHGGMTSHAAIVARGMGKPCVAGCEGLSIDHATGAVTIGKHELRVGDVITIDGGSGSVIIGAVQLVPPAIDENFGTILSWADDLRRLRVRANADTPEDAAKAREFGAEGIGLCRTEHMFMAEDRLPIVREMILARDEEERRSPLERLLPMQQGDFEGIFEATAGLPVTIRLLDPPLHEFLPSLEEATSDEMRDRIRQLHEANPMLGTRGCRLGLQFPEIYEMQVRAIVRAAKAVRERTGEAPLVEIMHPLVGFREELSRLRELTERVAAEEPSVEYLCGTMIELPRACLRADEIAAEADFFSFGTNDLTQTALGFSRDDAEGKFLTYYLEHGILEQNPFEVLDEEGVGDLMRIAVERGRGVKPHIKLGICGEHGGEPRSVAFCHSLGLDYVSCSPYRVPLARLAAAQAALADVGVTAVAIGG